MANSWTLEELAAMLGLTPRTIRSYIENSLLPGPDSMGRGARYTDKHLERLRAILAVKDKPGITLADIRQLLLNVSEEALIALAGDADAPAPGAASPEGPDNAAAAYLAKIRRAAAEPPRPRRPMDTPMQGPVHNLLEKLKSLGPPAKVDRKARAESWVRIEITPDVELHARMSHLGLAGRHALERIADYLRRELMGS